MRILAILCSLAAASIVVAGPARKVWQGEGSLKFIPRSTLATVGDWIVDVGSGKRVAKVPSGEVSMLGNHVVVVPEGASEVQVIQIRPYRILGKIKATGKLQPGFSDGRTFTYLRDNWISRASLPEGNLVAQRLLPGPATFIDYWAGKSYLWFNDHEVLQVSRDFASVVRSYTDVYPTKVDRLGYAGVTFYYRPQWIDPYGRPEIIECDIPDHRWSVIERTLSYNEERLVCSAYAVGPRETILGAYLTAFNRQTRKLVWRKPMMSRWPVIVGKYIVLDRGEDAKTIEVRRLSDGKLVQQWPVRGRLWGISSQGQMAVLHIDRGFEVYRVR